MQKKVMLCLGAVLVLAGLAASAQVRAADNPNNGTWKLNTEKSKFDPGPGPKMETITVTIDNGTETFKAEGTDGKGNPIASSFTAKTDGTEAPVEGNPNGDTISVKQVNPHHLVIHLKKGGKDTETVHVVVAKDGKSRTATYTGKNGEGKEVHDVLVFDKQM
jgi:hypothetical protein